jgi:gamma-glutamyltranspeptidase/glutathione hydrolase
MDDFVPGTESVNRIEGGKRPLSSMTPTVILTAEGKPFMTVGSPGGTRIFPTVAQVISHVIDHGMTIQEAIDAPRIFDNAGNKIVFEGGAMGLTPETVAALEAMGHAVEDRGEWNLYFGGVQGIVYQEDGTLHGGADPRRDGKALGF